MPYRSNQNKQHQYLNPSQPSDQPDNWDHCETSLIDQMLEQRKHHERRDALKRIGITSMGVFTVLAGVTLWRASRQPTLEERRRSMIIPIRCKSVLNQLAYYHHDELDDGTMRRITHHFKRCRRCRFLYEKTYDIEFA